MSSKASDIRNTTIAERASMDDIARMPALIDTVQGAAILGTTPLSIAKKCKDGTYPAVKVGRGWRINKRRFLEIVGLL